MLPAGLRVLVLLGVFALPLGAQATVHVFQSQLTGPPSTGNGLAQMFYDDSVPSFDLMISGVGLSAPITKAQIAGTSSGGPFVLDLLTPASFATGGKYTFSAMYQNIAGSPALLAGLLAQTLNVALTTSGPGPEISGQLTMLTPIPEPATWALAAAGLVVVAGSALRRRHGLNSR